MAMPPFSGTCQASQKQCYVRIHVNIQAESYVGVIPLCAGGRVYEIIYASLVALPPLVGVSPCPSSKTTIAYLDKTPDIKGGQFIPIK
ncbi:hypothetical protein ARMGADRAFT_1083148 [Armillaria gallica]|uniref:Uncharacterized protein n=1 Tax=Armillaria gallica TaxID=47427 RepID=A0A2H3D861_ARMGA|nr:hypothetical protein ARMGADRAFT_1083148 [Armillaria gallica]